MKNTLIAIISILSFSSCQPIMMKIYGIKDPDIESAKTITKKAHKYDMDTSNIVSVKSNDFLYELNGKSIPDAAIYDQNGKYIEYRVTDTSCNAGLFDFIPALKLNETYNQPDSADLKTQLAKFRDLKGNVLNELEPADFYVLIYWTVWTGKLNKNHAKIWEDLAKSNQNCKIKVMKVNMDIQDNWEEKDRDFIYRTLNKGKK